MKTSANIKRNIISVLAIVFAFTTLMFAFPTPAFAATANITTSGPITLNVGGTASVAATVATTSAGEVTTVSWSSSNTSVASVTATTPNTATITAVGPGTATITASPDAGGTPSTITVTVSPVTLTGISFSPSIITLSAGATQAAPIVFTPANASNKTVTWSSADTSVATVNPTTGVVTAVGQGSTTITAVSAQGPYTASLSVIVLAPDPVTGVSLNQSSVSLAPGSNAQLTATVVPPNATNKAVTWTSSNNSVATVDGTGRILAIANGTATITATTADGSFKATCVVTVGGSGSTTTGGSKYTASYSNGTTFRSNGLYNNLRTVSVDGRTISSSNYSAYAGSGNNTYVTLSDSYIESLSSGTHTLSMNFTDGSGSTTFGVSRTTAGSTLAPGPVVVPPVSRPLGNTTGSTTPSTTTTTSKKGSIAASDSNKYIIDEKVDDGVFETTITE